MANHVTVVHPRTMIFEITVVQVIVLAFAIGKMNVTSRWRKCGILLVLSANLLLGALLDDECHEWIEHNFFKHDGKFALVHRVLQGGRQSTTFKRSEAVFLFLHVPRTAGDAMETAAFGAPDFVYTPYSYASVIRENPFMRYNVSLVGNDTMFVSGYFNANDIELLRKLLAPRTLRIFTFLRDPVERVLSFIDFQPGEGEADPTRTRFFGNPSPSIQRVRDYLVDSVAHQLGQTQWGDHVVGPLLSRDDLLARAKATLDACEFVGFYETLAEDFWRLHTEFFGDSVSVPYFYPFTFWVGAYVSKARITVRKFALRLKARNTTVFEHVKANVEMDQELFDYAVAKYGPHVKLYENYVDFIWDHVFHWICVVGGFSSMCCLVTKIPCCSRKERLGTSGMNA